MSTAALAWGKGTLSEDAERRFVRGVEYCGRFFIGQAEAQTALYKLTAILEKEGLPYAIIGAFALNEYGHRRVTVDVDLVMTEEDLTAFKQRYLGKGTRSGSRGPESSSTQSWVSTWTCSVQAGTPETTSRNPSRFPTPESPRCAVSGSRSFR